MPSASRRAVTSAEVPAGNSTVISIGPFWGNSCAWAGSASAVPRTIHADLIALSLVPGEDFRDLDAPPLARRHDPRSYHGERPGGRLSVHLRRALPARRLCELLQLLDEGVVLRAGH